jgi:hypothetical protein
MVRPIEQIEQDLTQMRTASSQLGSELMATYKSYFASLAPTLKKQSIQGCYYLCTNCYPEAFLELNYNRRSQLLRTLQRVVSNVITDLVVQIEPSARTNDEDETTGELTSMPAIPIDWFATPSSLSTWQQNLEAEISHSLKEISYKANLLLQQAQILPVTIPKPILEANPEVDRQGGNNTNIPNLLSVLIESEGDDKEVESQPPATGLMGIDLQSPAQEDLGEIIQIHSLFLRLTEVEFSDVTVLSLRKNISQAVNKINSLRRDYVQKQQELKIAEAASAWRNSWFED